MVIRLLWNGLLLRQFCQWSLGDVEGCKYDTSRRLWWQLVVLVTVVSAPCRIDLGNVNYGHFNFFYKCCLIMTFKLQMITDTCPRERRGLGRHWAGVGTSVPTLGRRRSICSAVWWVRLYVFQMTFYMYIPVQSCGLHTIPLMCYTRISIYHAVIYHPAFYVEFYVYTYICVFDVPHCVACWNFMYSYVLCQKWRIKHVQSINQSINHIINPVQV